MTTTREDVAAALHDHRTDRTPQADAALRDTVALYIHAQTGRWHAPMPNGDSYQDFIDRYARMAQDISESPDEWNAAFYA